MNFEHEEKVKKFSNVLLLSHREDEYNQLKEYGFKKIDWFKSIMVAYRYFKQHPEELDKYHIVMEGALDFSNNYFLDDLKNKFISSEHIVYCSYLKSESYHKNYEGYFKSINTLEITSFLDFIELIDIIMSKAIGLDVLNLNNEKYKNAEPINNIYKNYQHLPKRKSELKILCIDSDNKLKSIHNISKELGLNIDASTHIDDDKYGEYDIIIASSLYRLCLFKNEEYNEQYKYNGRRLGLMVEHDWNHVSYYDENRDIRYFDSDMAKEEKLTYIYTGSLGINSSLTKSFYVVRGDDNSNLNIKAIISEAVNLYNERLVKATKKGIIDLDFKVGKDYTEEFEMFKSNIDKKNAKVLKPIDDFIKMENIVDNYLENINWVEDDDSIYVDKNNGKITIELREYDKLVNKIAYNNQNNDTYIEFVLNDKEKMALYTNKYKNRKKLPKSPNDEELKTLEKIENIVCAKLNTLIEEAENIKYQNYYKNSYIRSKITDFDSNLRNPIMEYLYLEKNSLVPRKIEGINISEDKKFINFSIEYKGQILGGIIFKKNYDSEELREFDIYYLNNKGNLQRSDRIGYCTHQLKNSKTTLKEPSEKCEKVMEIIKKKINSTLKPLNKGANNFLHDCQNNILVYKIRKNNGYK